MVSVEQNAEIGIREIPGQSAGVRFIAIKRRTLRIKCDGGWPGRRKQGAVSLKEQYSGSQTATVAGLLELWSVAAQKKCPLPSVG